MKYIIILSRDTSYSSQEKEISPTEIKARPYTRVWHIVDKSQIGRKSKGTSDWCCHEGFRLLLKRKLNNLQLYGLLQGKF